MEVLNDRLAETFAAQWENDDVLSGDGLYAWDGEYCYFVPYDGAETRRAEVAHICRRLKVKETEEGLVSWVMKRHGDGATRMYDPEFIGGKKELASAPRLLSGFSGVVIVW